jgi:FkbM family methyltransferase
MIYLKYLKLIRQYDHHISLFHKLKLSIYIVLQLLFKQLSWKPFIKIDNIWFKVLDLETLEILNPIFEYWMWKYLKVNHNEVFIDVGAHVGKYSLPIAKQYPDSIVIAIEPAKDTFLALTEGIRKNKIKNIIPLNIAAFSTSTKLKLFVLEVHGCSTLIDDQAKYLSKRIIRIDEVDARPLDDIVEKVGLKRIDWVKIDVEGAELHVLRGFRNGIIKFKPRVIIEIKEFNRREVFKFFEEVNYTCHHIPEDESGEYFICVPKN